jgi:hypothetical protein
MGTYAQATGQQLMLDTVELLREGLAAGLRDEMRRLKCPQSAGTAHGPGPGPTATNLLRVHRGAPEMDWEQHSKDGAGMAQSCLPYGVVADGPFSAVGAVGNNPTRWGPSTLHQPLRGPPKTCFPIM